MGDDESHSPIRPNRELTEINVSSMDITDLRNTKDMLSKKTETFPSSKITAISILTGSIAHDFNNILTAIIGYSEMIRLDFQQDR